MARELKSSNSIPIDVDCYCRAFGDDWHLLVVSQNSSVVSRSVLACRFFVITVAFGCVFFCAAVSSHGVGTYPDHLHKLNTRIVLRLSSMSPFTALWLIC